jgi:hypothetical protein
MRSFGDASSLGQKDGQNNDTMLRYFSGNIKSPRFLQKARPPTILWESVPDRLEEKEVDLNTTFWRTAFQDL